MPLFNYESGYLQDSPLLTTGSATAATQMGNIKTQLDAVTAAVSDSTYANVVSQQKKVRTMIDAENTRLDLKKSSIDQAETGQQRIMRLNDSYVKRSREYLKIVVAAVFILGTLALIYTLDGRVEGGVFPSGVMTFITIILVSMLCIYGVTVYIGIMKRDNIDFDKLNPKYLPSVLADATQRKTGSGGNLLGQFDVGACVGSSCCAQGTQWEVATQTCRQICSTDTPNWNKLTGTCVANACTTTGTNPLPNWNALTGNCVAACESGKVWDPIQYQCARSVAGFATMDTAYQLGEMPPPRKKRPTDITTPPYVPNTVFQGNRL